MSIYKEKFFRNLGVINEEEQELLRNIKIAIVGLGGTGGTAFECLLRIGCENFILFDHDQFELTNFNRQILSTEKTIDCDKTKIAIERAKNINNNVKISPFGSFDSSKLKNVDIIIDGTDNIETRFKISKFCYLKKIPYVFSSVGFATGLVSVFIDRLFEKTFQLPRNNLENYNTCTSVIAPATMIIGSLASSQALNYMLKKAFVKAPEILFLDLFSKDIFYKKTLE